MGTTSNELLIRLEEVTAFSLQDVEAAIAEIKHPSVPYFGDFPDYCIPLLNILKERAKKKAIQNEIRELVLSLQNECIKKYDVKKVDPMLYGLQGALYDRKRGKEFVRDCLKDIFLKISIDNTYIEKLMHAFTVNRSLKNSFDRVINELETSRSLTEISEKISV